MLQEVTLFQGCPVVIHNSVGLVDVEVSEGLWVTQTLHRLKKAWVKHPGMSRSQISTQANSRLQKQVEGVRKEWLCSCEDWPLVLGAAGLGCAASGLLNMLRGRIALI